MLIRNYTDDDLGELEKIHAAQGLPYKFPNLKSSLFLSKIVLERDSKIVAAALLRLTAEAYVLLDRSSGTPADRWRALLLLHEATRGDAARKGLDDAHCWVPPEVARSFGRRIESLGWEREQWKCFSRMLADPTPGL
jgi:hypothetical protein